MKRLIIGLATLLSATLLLAACAGPSGGSQGGTDPSGEPPPSAAGSEAAPQASQEKQALFGEFRVQDLEGNEYGPELFKDKKLTMVNFWATFCSPCLDEMPDLAALQEEFAEQGVQIVGVVSDALDMEGKLVQEQVDKAKQLADKTGAAYLHLLPTDDAVAGLAMSLPVVPVTAFVDENGDIVGQVYPGAKSKADWKAIIEERLKDVNG